MNPLILVLFAGAGAYAFLKPKKQSSASASFDDAISEGYSGKVVTQTVAPTYAPVYRKTAQATQTVQPVAIAAIPFKRPTNFKTSQWLAINPANATPNEFQYKINECAKALIGAKNAFRNQSSILNEITILESELDNALRAAGIAANKSEVFIMLANCQNSANGETLHSPRKVIVALNNGGSAEAYKVDWYEFTTVVTAENYASIASSLPNELCRHNNLDIPAPYGVGFANVKSTWVRSNRQQAVKDSVVALQPKGEIAAHASEDGVSQVIAWNTDQGNVLVRYDVKSTNASGLVPNIQKKI